MASRVFFFHNPKAGGTSLSAWLGTQIQQQACPIIENDALQHERNGGNYVSHRGFNFYSGHYGYDIFLQVNAGHLPITNFRHPITRIVSLYNYFRFDVKVSEALLRSEAYFAVNAAKSMTIHQFVTSDDPCIQLYVRNHHFRQLTASGWTNEPGKSLDEAIQFVACMPWYYVCEFPELSLWWAHQTLGWDSKNFPYANRTSSASERIVVTALPLATINAITALNAQDLAVYSYAVQRLTTEVVFP